MNCRPREYTLSRRPQRGSPLHSGNDDQAATLNAHEESVDATLVPLETDASGLTEADAAARLAEHGPNRLPEPPRRGCRRGFFA